MHFASDDPFKQQVWFSLQKWTRQMCLDMGSLTLADYGTSSSCSRYIPAPFPSNCSPPECVVWFLFTKVCRHILPEMVQAFWCWKRKWFGKLKWNNEMSTRNRTALNRWLVSTLLWRLIQRAKYYAKFTFQSYLNINVCWQCVYTATL